MSKVKQYYTDLTEKNVDDIMKKYVVNEISFNDAKSKIMKLDNLNLLNHNRSGVNEYIYAWVAPFGEYDDSIDIMTSNGKYLVSRLVVLRIFLAWFFSHIGFNN